MAATRRPSGPLLLPLKAKVGIEQASLGQGEHGNDLEEELVADSLARDCQARDDGLLHGKVSGCRPHLKGVRRGDCWSIVDRPRPVACEKYGGWVAYILKCGHKLYDGVQVVRPQKVLLDGF